MNLRPTLYKDVPGPSLRLLSLASSADLRPAVARLFTASCASNKRKSDLRCSLWAVCDAGNGRQAGLPVIEASSVAGVGKSAAAIAPATATGIAEAATATVGPATPAAVAPGSDVRMDVHRSLEQG